MTVPFFSGWFFFRWYLVFVFWHDRGLPYLRFTWRNRQVTQPNQDKPGETRQGGQPNQDKPGGTHQGGQPNQDKPGGTRLGGQPNQDKPGGTRQGGQPNQDKFVSPSVCLSVCQ